MHLNQENNIYNTKIAFCTNIQFYGLWYISKQSETVYFQNSDVKWGVEEALFSKIPGFVFNRTGLKCLATLNSSENEGWSYRPMDMYRSLIRARSSAGATDVIDGTIDVTPDLQKLRIWPVCSSYLRMILHHNKI